jgi:hypothetical protein
VCYLSKLAFSNLDIRTSSHSLANRLLASLIWLARNDHYSHHHPPMIINNIFVLPIPNSPALPSDLTPNMLMLPLPFDALVASTHVARVLEQPISHYRNHVRTFWNNFSQGTGPAGSSPNSGGIQGFCRAR